MDVLLSERQLKKLFEQDATADPAAQAPTAGTSSKQTGGQGYPEVGKWESGVTRGPANQVGITKWADVVGSKLNRGKANPLKENEYTKEGILNLMEQLKSDDSQITIFKGRGQPKPPVPASQTPIGDYSKMDKNGNITYPYRIVHKDLKDPFTYNDPYYWVYTTVIPSKSIYGTETFASSIGDKKEMEGLYKSELDKWLQSNAKTTLSDVQRVAGRTTKTGKDVPPGYHVEEYDEYKAQVDPLVKQIESIKASKYNASGWYNTSTRELTKEELKQLGELRWKVNLLNKKYYSKDYPDGLSQEEKKQMKSWNESIEEHYKNEYQKNGCDPSNTYINFNDIKQPIIKNDNDATRMYHPDYNRYNFDNSNKNNGWLKDVDVAKEVSKNLHPDQTTNPISTVKSKESICIKLRSEEQYAYNEIKEYFKYAPDKRTKFEKIWDEWEPVIQIGGSILLSLVLPEIGIPAASAYYAAIDATFNLAIGAYQLSRGKNEQAAMSVLFAILPNLKVGKLAIPKDIAKSISEKLAVSNIKSTLDMATWIEKTLTKEEQRWFSIVLNSDKSLLESASKQGLSKMLGKLEANGVPVAKEQVENLSKKWIGRSLRKTKLIAPTVKLLPRFIFRPKVLQVVFELGVMDRSSAWIKSIEEKTKTKLEEKQKKNLEIFWESLPDDIRFLYTKKISGKNLDIIAQGDPNAIIDTIDDIEEYQNEINDKTGQPYTKEEMIEINKIAKEKIRERASLYKN